MKKLFFTMLMLIILSSCNSHEGEIVKTEECWNGIKRIKLRNLSSHDAFKFTIKKTTESKEGKNSETFFRNLGPGEEANLGCEKSIENFYVGPDGYEYRGGGDSTIIIPSGIPESELKMDSIVYNYSFEIVGSQIEK